MENKHQVIGLFLDLAKAYDVLYHLILLDKLENMELEVWQISGFNPIC
jgi:hypothetical protein